MRGTLVWRWRAEFLRQSGHVLSRRASWGPKVAGNHGGGTQVGHALQGVVQVGHHSGVFKHIKRTTGSLNRLIAMKHIGKPGVDQHQILKPHHLHGPRCAPNVARMGGVNQNKSRAHTRVWVSSEAVGVA